MIFKLFFIILAISKIAKSDLTFQDHEIPNEVTDAITLTIPLAKISAILTETVKNNENLKDLIEWLNIKDESLEVVLSNVTWQLQDLKESINGQSESLEIIQQQNSDLSKSLSQQKNLLKLLTKDVFVIKKFLNESIDLKSLNQNRDWTVIQRRQDGSEDFYRSWSEYKRGFGNPNGEFFIGLEKLHAMTTYGARQELLIIMEDFQNQTRYAKYQNFVIGSELEKFAINELGEFTGDAGDSLRYHLGQKFSTKDQDNDNNEAENCAEMYLKGAWWFDNCFTSHLNGPYIHGETGQKGGINWIHWHGNEYSLKFVEMMIRSAT